MTLHASARMATAVVAVTLSLAGQLVAPSVAGELVAPAAAGEPLGTLTPRGGTQGCPAGQECMGFEVQCPGLQEAARGQLSIARPLLATRGVVVFASGGQGVNWWGDSPEAAQMIEELRANGIMAVQLRWRNSWLKSRPAEQAGPARLACRPATVFKWVHDNHFTPLGLPEVGACGFCISGSSGGASQVSYPLSHYGLDLILDAVVPTGGPAHAALIKGCMQTPGEEEYWFAPSEASIIDVSYGHYQNGGPCVRHDSLSAALWAKDGIDTGGNDYFHPTTRIHFIFGRTDSSVAPVHARDYITRLQRSGSPSVTEQLVDSGHTVQESPAGADAIKTALLGS